MKQEVFYKESIKPEDILKLIKGILYRDKDIIFAYIFGSFIDNSRFFRDIDIAVYLSKIENRFLKDRELREKLSDEFFKKGFKDFSMDSFDIIFFNIVPFDFAMKILEKGKLLFSKDEDMRRDYIEHISMQYRMNKIVIDEALR